VKKVNIYEAKTRLSRLVEPLVLLTNDGVLAGYGDFVKVV
jgi:hypothetical protein